MTCRDFRIGHLEYVDGTCSEAERVAAQAHLDACPSCLRFDFVLRRALLLARNLPPLAAAPGFQERLNARLARERLTTRPTAGARRALGRTAAAAVLAAAGALGAGSVALMRPPQVTPVLEQGSAAAVAPAPVFAPARPRGAPAIIRVDPLAPPFAATPLCLAPSPVGAPSVRFITDQPASFRLFPAPR